MEKKQNILIVHNYYQIPGGEDSVVANEKGLLEQHGHAVFLYTRHNSEIKEMSKIRKLLLPFIAVFNFRTYGEIKKTIKEKQIDVVHVHNTWNLISPAVYYAARACKVPVVQTIHNFRLLCPGATFYRDGHVCEECVEKGLGCAVKHSCYRNSKAQTLVNVVSNRFHRLMNIYGKINYLCLTDFNKEKLLQLKQIKAEKVFVKPNFVENDNEIVSARERENRIVYAGRLDKLKGVDIMLEAWKQLGKEAPELVICGTGPMEDWCRKFVADNHLENVQFKGFIPNEEVRKLIATGKALVLSTQWYEGFPMSIVEAFSVGTPVIGSDIGNVGDIIEEGVSGVKFQNDSATALAEAVRKIKNDNGDIHEKVAQVYRSKYSAEVNYIQLSMIYNSITP